MLGTKSVRKVLFPILATVFFVLEGVLQNQWVLNSDYRPALIISAGMCVSLGLAGAFPVYGGLLYLIFHFISIFLNIEMTIPTLGLYVIASDWISRRWYLASVGLLVSAEIGLQHQLGFTSVSLLGSVLGITGAVVIGFMLRWSQERVDASREEARVARETAREKVYRDLAVELHDTVVRDLSRVIVAAELLTREPNSPALVEQIHASAHEALKSTRTMMAGFAKPEEEETFQQVVGKCGQMLATRSIQLNVDIPDDLHGSMSREAYGALILTLKEGAANILKYASAGSEAELLVERQSSEEVLLTLSNDCGEKVASEPLLSGGFGLENLAARLSNQGGKLSYMKVSDRWILVAEIQMGQPTMPTSEFTPRSEISQPGNARSGKNGLKQ